LLCNSTVTLLWKCNKLIVTQQELLRYYGNAIGCIGHATKEILHYMFLSCFSAVFRWNAHLKAKIELYIEYKIRKQ
jgi:hypothetical protein